MAVQHFNQDRVIVKLKYLKFVSLSFLWDTYSLNYTQPRPDILKLFKIRNVLWK
jgi:hypothetical protein